MPKIVVNSTPLIILCNIDKLSILKELYGEVCVPEAVFNELTATPYYNKGSKQIKFKNAVYEYPLSESIKDGYTRTPYAVTRQNIKFFNFGDDDQDKMMINDGILCHERIKEKLESYSKENGTRVVMPFMMIVCKDTNLTLL